MEYYGYNRNYFEWKHFKNTAKKLLSYNNGKVVIFGSTVRDILLRRHAAERFYDNCKTEDESKLYHDRSFMSETIDRLLIPTSINVFVPKNYFQTLLENINHYDEYTSIVKQKDDKYSSEHYIGFNSYISGNTTPWIPILKVNFFLYSTDVLPTIPPDFWCNTLLISHSLDNDNVYFDNVVPREMHLTNLYRYSKQSCQKSPSTCLQNIYGKTWMGDR